MRHHTASGILLIAGSLLVVFVMMHHPTGHGLMKPESFERMAFVNKLVHGFALATVPMIFLGLMGVARRLGWTDLSIASLVAFAFGSFAVMLAALASGFVFTDIAARAMEPGASSDLHPFLMYTGVWNQASAPVHLVATAIGTLLLGAALLAGRGRVPMAAAAGAGGLAVGAATILLYFSGHLRLDVHGAFILYALQSAWTVWLGVAMCMKDRPSAP